LPDSIHSMIMINIRQANESDIEAIKDIYNQAILRTTATFDTEIKSFNDRREWLRGHGDSHPVVVAEEELIVGWASLSRWSEKCAYEGTVELSVYVDEKMRGKGAGRKLLRYITNEGRKKGFHTIISRITQHNEISIKLHEDAGYKYTGTIYEAGKKFGKFLDVLFYQIIFKENA
jgi:L-amino acid N-acyltransferase